jgi:filamentous hemagglutinin family protein
LNRIYRLVWNRTLGVLQVASEFARGRTKGGRAAGRGRAQRLAWLAGVPLALPMMALAATPMITAPRVATLDPGPTIVTVAPRALPTGGTVTAGSGSITQDGGTLTVTQQSQNLSLNWQSFNIGADGTVDFLQPNAQSIAVNRIGDPNGSVILGHLNANGQVFLINPNGVLFGQGAQVNVGGLVASTLDVSDSELGSGSLHFSGSGTGRVVNRGSIDADHGYVALLGPQVTNAGILRATGGSVALAGGTAVTLSFDGNRLLSLQVDKSTLNALADNRQLIVADGGQVLMSAGARDSLLASVVNNSGTIQAQTVANRGGKIVLLGGMAAGTTIVAGRLDASAPNGGNGGFIETSAAHVKVGDDARVATAAGMGLTGSWLIDPVDFTIAAAGGDITGAQLSTNLAGTDITIQSTSGGSGSAGDVNVNDAVSWSAHKLTLNAQNNININANLNASSTASLALEFGQGAVAAGNASNVITHNGASVNLPAGTTNFTTKQGSDGTVKAYTVITSLGAAGSTTGTDLQGIGSGVSTQNFALGADIDASATSGWNAGAGFLPDAPNFPNFTGTFDGLGHIISNLTINRPLVSRVGLFEKIGNGGVVRNVGLVGGSITGNSMVGGLVGENAYGTISNSYTTGTVHGSSYTGGLVGNNYGGAISNSYATGAVSGGSYTGGLVGNNNYGGSTISNSYASGTVSGSSSTGGLAGRSNGTVSNSYASGAVSSTGSSVGGLIGYNASTISNSYATGAVSGGSSVGGLAGFNNGTVTASFWDTTTSGQATSAGGVGMTTADMQTQANFTSATAANGNVNPAWDLANTWTVYDGHTSPLLRSFMTALTVTASNDTKTYDGLAYSGGNGATYSTTPNGNLLGTLSYGGTSQSATNAGSYAITGSGLYSNQQGYLISYGDGALTVNKADLALSGTRTYDGSNAVAGSVLTATGVHGETFAVTGAGNTSNLASKNVQTGSTLASVNGLALGTSGNGGLSGNYNALSTTGSSVSITKANLTLSGTRTYDGSSAVAGSILTATGVVGETFAVTGTGNTSNLASKNVQIGSTLASVTGLTLGASGNGGLSGNYNVLSTASSAVSVTKADLALSGTRSYDGSSAVAGSILTATGVAGETFTVTGTGDTTNLSSKNVQTGNTLASIAGLTLGTSGNGGLSGNYNVLSTASSAVSVTKAALALGTSDVTKTYDGGLTAAGTAVVISGTLFGTDALSGGSFAFTDKNAGSNKTVTTSGVTVADGNGGNNYAVTYADNTASDITALGVTVAATGSNRVYDGSTADAVSLASSGILAGDTVSFSGTGAFADKNVGTGKTVAVSGIAASGMDAGNYSFASTAATTANITALGVTVAATGSNRVYDGSTADAVSLASSGILAGDTVSFSGTGAFADKNVGTGKTVAVSGIAASGMDAGNYSFASTAATTANITALGVTVAATGSNRVYDGSTADAVSLASSGILAGDTVSFSGTGAFADKNVGTGKTVAVSGIAASGMDAGNYSFASTAATTANITALGVTVAATGSNRVYDGSTADAVSLASSGILAGDTVSFSGTGAFADKNVGTGKTVAVSGIAASGMDAGNYSFASTAATTANITALGVTVAATGSNRVYDGSTADAVSLASSGILAGDTVSFSGTGAFADKNVGTGKTVAVSGIVASGMDAGNYSFASTAATTADITPATLTYLAAPASFPAGHTPTGLGGEVQGLVGGDTLSDAITGTLAWATPATSASPAGQYAIDGSGLAASNYVFVQAPGNAGALHVDNGSAGSAPAAVSAVLAELQQDNPVQQGEITRRRLTRQHGLATPDIRIVDGGVHLP